MRLIDTHAHLDELAFDPDVDEVVARAQREREKREQGYRERALKMYQTLNVPVLGIVENMSYYLCPKCGNRDEIFDNGGAEEAAKALSVPFLGAIPLNASVRLSADSGQLGDNFVGSQDKVTAALDALVQSFCGEVEAVNAKSSGAPTLTIE